MANSCLICTHTNRLEIDREIVKGGNLAKIARVFGVEYNSLYNHAKEHVSRQLVQAYSKKQLAEDFELVAKIDQIVSRAELIFQRNFDKNRDALALKALDSQRNTIELLAKISYSLHQAKIAELEIIKAQSNEHDSIRVEEIRGQMSVLTKNELLMLNQLQNKIANQSREAIIPDVYVDFEEIEESGHSSAKSHKGNVSITPRVKRTRKRLKTPRNQGF